MKSSRSSSGSSGTLWSYWLYTNDPYDNKKRKEAFETHGFEKGLEILAGGQP